jgi:2-desacetyl-2-hydroxyethyl bacteriochlorophyllide A dehydrogenase
MRAALFPTPGEVSIVERETPVPTEGHALVRVEASGVCGTDLHIFQGEFPAQFPIIPGHEFAGVVEQVGQRVSALRPGDRVVIDPNLNCGTCRPCQRGLTHLCQNLVAIGVTLDGGFSTHCSVPARQLYKMPPQMSFEVGAMAEPVACCVHGIERAQVRPGEVAVLLGAGLIGLVMLQLALLRGAASVIVSEPDAAKRELAMALGASAAVDPGSEDPMEAVRKATGGSGADVVIDCVGGRETAQQALGLPGEGGRVLLFGVAPPDAEVTIKPYDIYAREIVITGSFINPFTHGAALALLASGRVRVSEIISHRMTLGQVPEALGMLGARQARKIIVEPQRAEG